MCNQFKNVEVRDADHLRELCDSFMYQGAKSVHAHRVGENRYDIKLNVPNKPLTRDNVKGGKTLID